MMPTASEYENGELVDSYDLGEAECPVCGYPVIGHFKSGVLVETEPCQGCEGEELKGDRVGDGKKSFLI
ncbi:MAG: hypothetical protein OIN88_13690 [Candidatus Methanoperedens sp.]|nr:hypothetical protein [Candidatus Methanoperedens sp.]